MIGAFFTSLWGRIVGTGSLFVIGATVVWRVLANAKAAGRTEQRLEDANAGLAGRIKAQETVDAIRDDVRGLDAAARLQRLRDNERRARERAP